MFSDYSTYVPVYFYDLLNGQKEIYVLKEIENHKVTVDLMVTWVHYWKLCGPFASLSDTYNLLKIYDDCSLNWIDDLNVSDDLNVIDCL